MAVTKSVDRKGKGAITKRRFRYTPHGKQKRRTEFEWEERTYRVEVRHESSGRWVSVGMVVKRDGCWGHVNSYGQNVMAVRQNSSSREIEADQLMRSIRQLAYDLGWIDDPINTKVGE